MEKIVVFYTNRAFIENNLVAIDGLINLFADVDIRFMMDMKPADYEFINSVKHLKIVERDVMHMQFTKPNAIADCAADAFFLDAELHTKVASGQDIRTEDVAHLILNNDKEIILRVNEDMKSFNRNQGSLSIMDKIFDVLSNVQAHKMRDNLIINYHFDSGRNTTTNQHIDDMVKTIRSSISNLHNGIRIPVILSGKINQSNLLSYCVTNNIDGFLIEEPNLSVESMMEIVRMVHG